MMRVFVPAGLSYKFDKPETDSNVNIPNSELEVTLTRTTKEAFTFLGFSERSIDMLMDDNTEIDQSELIKILSESTYYRYYCKDFYCMTFPQIPQENAPNL